MPNEDSLKPVKVFCPVCQELLEAVPTEQIQRLQCPLCGSEVIVPTRAHAAMSAARKRLPPKEEIGEYAVAAPVESPRPAVRNVAAPGPQTVGFTARIPCPGCGKRVGTRLEDRPKRVNCPHCGFLVDVPSRAGAAGEGQATAGAPAKPTPPTPRPAAPPLAAPRAPAPAASVFDAMAGVRTLEIDPPPRWAFFSGVFGFPFRGKVWSRWALLAMGFTLLLLIGALAHWLSQGDPARLVVRLVLLGLPSLWIFVWSASYAAVLGLAIIEGTAAGNDRIESWPEPNWRDWMLPFIATLWIAGLSASAGYGAARLLELASVPVPGAMAAFGLALFPVLVLSALESGQVLFPFSVPVLRSMVSWWWAWGLFELLAAAILAAPPATGWVLFRFSPMAAALVAGPALAASILIYARLLGRLGWRVSGVEQRLKRLRVINAVGSAAGSGPPAGKRAAR